MKNGKKLEDLIFDKLEHIEAEIKEIRQTDIPNIKTDIAVVKTTSSSYTRLIAGIGGLLAVATSAAIAWLR